MPGSARPPSTTHWGPAGLQTPDVPTQQGDPDARSRTRTARWPSSPGGSEGSGARPPGAARREGARVAICAPAHGRAWSRPRTASGRRRAGRCSRRSADVSRADRRRGARRARSCAQFGGVDILVNNAGTSAAGGLRDRERRGVAGRHRAEADGGGALLPARHPAHEAPRRRAHHQHHQPRRQGAGRRAACRPACRARPGST